MKHKAQEALDDISKMLYTTDYVEHIRCQSYPIMEDEQAVIQQSIDNQLTVEELRTIVNCLSVACFDEDKYHSIFSKLKNQKEMWEVE